MTTGAVPLGLTQIQSMPGGRLDGAVGFDGDGEAARVDDGQQRFVQLQQRFAAGEDDVAVGGVGTPGGLDGIGEQFGAGEFAAAVAVGADEVGVAEGAGGAGAVALAAGPEITAREPAEDRRAARVGAFALQGLEDFFGGVGHDGGRRGRRRRE